MREEVVAQPPSSSRAVGLQIGHRLAACAVSSAICWRGNSGTPRCAPFWQVLRPASAAARQPRRTRRAPYNPAGARESAERLAVDQGGARHRQPGGSSAERADAVRRVPPGPCSSATTSTCAMSGWPARSRSQPLDACTRRPSTRRPRCARLSPGCRPRASALISRATSCCPAPELSGRNSSAVSAGRRHSHGRLRSRLDVDLARRSGGHGFQVVVENHEPCVCPMGLPTGTGPADWTASRSRNRCRTGTR